MLGKCWPLGSLVCDVFLCFCHFPLWYPGSGVVLDCIDSWSMPSSLLCCALLCILSSLVRLALLNRFKPSSKIFYWPFQGGTSFVDLLCFCSVLCLLCLCARLFICALLSPAGKGLTSWLSFVVSTVSLSLSHWYPGSGVVLDCIDSWSLHPYLLCNHLDGEERAGALLCLFSWLQDISQEVQFWNCS